MATSKSAGFVTSRGYALPTDKHEMADVLWYNIWQRRLWPYEELQESDTLYWYDSTAQAIVWKSRIHKIERFEFANKEEVRKRFQAVFGETRLNDAYFEDSSDHGYCIAYKIDDLVRLNVPKPAGYKFPRKGWLHCSDEDAHAWLTNLPTFESPDGPAAAALAEIATKITEVGYFSPASLRDERKRTLKEIVERRGERKFRNKLIAAYAGRCSVTGCDAVAALEAAHIKPYCGPQSDHVTNGLLLRADIHTLFDLYLIGIDSTTHRIKLAPPIKGTAYVELEGRELALPTNAADAPNGEALAERWKQFVGGKEAP
jgi:hypothetical protein